jgi:small subunit ribosomal protein S8
MDRIADFIIALKNAGPVRHKTVTVPYSRMKHSIAKVLLDRGYIAAFEKKEYKKGPVLAVDLKYSESGPRITDVKRISKPSRRMYAGVRDVKPIMHGHGLLVLSTPKGVMSGEDAHKERVGGEVLFEIY